MSKESSMIVNLLCAGGVCYGLLFGVVLSLILLLDVERTTYTEDGYLQITLISISGWIVGSPFFYILIRTAIRGDEEIHSSESVKEVKD